MHGMLMWHRGAQANTKYVPYAYEKYEILSNGVTSLIIIIILKNLIECTGNHWLIFTLDVRVEKC